MTHNAGLWGRETSYAHTHAHTHTVSLYAATLGLRCQGGEPGAHAAKENPFEIYSRSACPAGCANICSKWPQDWHGRGPSMQLDLGSMATVF